MDLSRIAEQPVKYHPFTYNKKYFHVSSVELLEVLPKINNHLLNTGNCGGHHVHIRLQFPEKSSDLGSFVSELWRTTTKSDQSADRSMHDFEFNLIPAKSSTGFRAKKCDYGK